jgi:hypothetical protein
VLDCLHGAGAAFGGRIPAIAAWCGEVYHLILIPPGAAGPLGSACEARVRSFDPRGWQGRENLSDVFDKRQRLDTDPCFDIDRSVLALIAVKGVSSATRDEVTTCRSSATRHSDSS